MPVVCALMILSCLLSAVVTAETIAIRAVVSESNTPPYAIFNAEQMVEAGISKDILDELATALDKPIQYLNLPRSRVEPWLIEGKADIACFLNPDWVSEPAALDWSEALFTTQQLLVRRPESAPISAIQHLAGKRVGTTRGFTYPELEQVFALGDVIRDDAHSLQSNLARLKQGRLDVVMTVDLSFHYYLETTGEKDFVADPLWSEPPAVYCAISKTQPVLGLQIREGLTKLIQNGFIKRRLAVYMGNTAPD